MIKWKKTDVIKQFAEAMNPSKPVTNISLVERLKQLAIARKAEK